MRLLSVVLALVAFSFWQGCASDDDTPGTVPPGGGGTSGDFCFINCGGSGGDGDGGTGGVGGRGGSGGSAGAAGMGGQVAGSGGTGGVGGSGGMVLPPNPQGPVVQIVSPVNGTNIATSTIYTNPSLKVRCRVTVNSQTGQSVDTTSVKVDIVQGSTIIKTLSATASSQVNEYEATMPISDRPNGTITFRCSAGDTANPKRTSSDTVSILADFGPEITILSPNETSYYKDVVDVKFAVAESPVAVGDTGAVLDFGSLIVEVGGVQVMPTPTGNAGEYSVRVDFNDQALFGTTPLDEGSEHQEQLRVRIANSRTPVPVAREAQVLFWVDGKGPEIDEDAVRPLSSSSITYGGVIQLQVKATDPAGIDPASIRAEIVSFLVGENDLGGVNNPHVIGGFQPGDTDDTYVADFNTAILGSDPVVNVTFWVYDLAVSATSNEGNSTPYGYPFSLDTTPPVITLDSPDVREYKIQSGNNQCGERFDPLGISPNDLWSVAPFTVVRARVLDLANSASANGGAFFKADVNPASVELLVLKLSDTVINDGNPATEPTPLLVDSNNDGVCDMINPKVDPKSSQSTPATRAQSIALSALPPTGTSFFPASAAADFGSQSAFEGAFCSTAGTETNAPNLLCNGFSDLTRIVKGPVGETTIYTVSPGSGAACTGVLQGLPSGWVCMVVRAEDRNGNVGYSPPLRACVDPDPNGTLCPVAPGIFGHAGPNPITPDCTGAYNPTTQVVTATATCSLTDYFKVPANAPLNVIKQ